MNKQHLIIRLKIIAGVLMVAYMIVLGIYVYKLTVRVYQLEGVVSQQHEGMQIMQHEVVSISNFLQFLITHPFQMQ